MSVQDVYDAVVALNKMDIANLVQGELDGEATVSTIVQDGLIAAMNEVGRRFSQGDLFVPEMLMAAHVMQKGLDVLRPHLTEGDVCSSGTVVLGTVKGDLHDIGKNLVAMMLEGAGFKVIDIGVDIPGENFVTAVKEHQADVIGLSALLTTTMPAMEEAVGLLRKAEVKAKILVGGAPITESFSKQIGADGYGQDAPAAARLAKELLAS